MNISEIKCKTALNPSKLPGLDYSLNPYTGCQHKCVYCYVPNVMHLDRKKWGDFVKIKTNIPNVLSKEIRKKPKGIVGISTVTDPYQPVEKKYKLTRYCLQQLLIHDFPINIQTKSDLVTRDIKIISRFSTAEVIFSIATLKDTQRKILEPNSSKIQDRLNAMKKISKAGIKTSVFFGPIYPTIKTEEIKEIIHTFSEHGANKIMIDKFNLKPGIYQNIKNTLKKQDNTLDLFEKNLKDEFYFQKIRQKIIYDCKKRNLTFKDAF